MIKIKPLTNFPGEISSLADLWIANVGLKYFPNITKSEIESKLQNSMNEDRMPLTFVSMDGNKAIGMASLRDDTTVGSFGKSPCLAGVCVQSNYQGRGVGKLLVDTIKSEAFKLGFKQIWRSSLNQEVTDWYVGMGWERVEAGLVGGVKAEILHIKLSHEDLL